jgi:sugar phosphate isomerase/epimerase
VHPDDLPTFACSTVSLLSLSLHDAFPLVADAGFGAIEVMVTKDPDTQDAARLRELAEDAGLRIAAIHAPFLLMTRRVWGTDPVGKIERAVALADQVEAPLVVVHPPYRWQSRYRRWLDDGLGELAARVPVRVAVENMFPVKVRGRSLGAYHAVRSLEDLAGFEHVVLDTSHAAVAGHDLVGIVEHLGERLAHVHLSDNPGRGWDSHLPPGEGILPLDAFLRALGDRGYGGTISFEIDLRRHGSDRAALRDALADALERCRAALPLPA